ncbi:MAG: cell division protein ZapA [Hyphomicrobiaceae bacterium]|nr:cell division protein ZapA [Hyphomicrobiaceae bacterium]MCC0024153.1 cell division protein ZapA [Hyphomicrobiaceae bacterium]
MAEVNVEINGRKYRMACEEGQEPHLTALADRFNSKVEQFKGAFGEIGDNRLTVMAGIAVLDEMAELEAKLEDIRGSIADIEAERDRAIKDAADQESQFARKLAETARKIEAVAVVIDETALGQ